MQKAKESAEIQAAAIPIWSRRGLDRLCAVSVADMEDKGGFIHSIASLKRLYNGPDSPELER